MRKKIKIKNNFIDRAVAFIAPVRAAKRMRARLAMEITNSYTGASRSKRSLKQWSPGSNDADSDILSDLTTLRDRSRDLEQNNPIASGVLKTKVTNVVGTGLRLQSRIDRDVLKMSDEQADEWELNTEREWRLFFNSKDLDVARIMDGKAITRMVYDQKNLNGDVFVLLPRVKRPGSAYDLRLQIIESDRCSNPDGEADSNEVAGGIKKDSNGAPTKYYFQRSHPGAIDPVLEWDHIPAFGAKTGLRNVIHYYKMHRPGQSRGVPDLSTVIEPLKQLDRYTEAEITAAVISGMFTVFIETESGDVDFDPTSLSDETGGSSSDDDVKLSSGAIVGLADGEKVHDTNPGRPNQAFDPFVQAILRQVGIALEVPFEILIKHFTASYSASRAALLEAWKYFISEREHLADNFLKLVYEVWMYEAVAKGRISAPGFFSDPRIKQAYLDCVFVGPARGQIDELKEVKAAKERIGMGLTTLASETAELTGGDWESNHRQSVKEYQKRKSDGLIQEESKNGKQLPDKKSK